MPTVYVYEEYPDAGCFLVGVDKHSGTTRAALAHYLRTCRIDRDATVNNWPADTPDDGRVIMRQTDPMTGNRVHSWFADSRDLTGGTGTVVRPDRAATSIAKEIGL